MIIHQLSLFDQPIPSKINNTLIPIETCDTGRAAQLLKIHRTTLDRIRRQGQTSYQKSRWVAQLQNDRKTWQVCFQTSA